MYERIYVQRCFIDNLDCEWQWQILFILLAPVHYSSLPYSVETCMNFCCNGRVTDIQNNEAWRRTSV